MSRKGGSYKIIDGQPVLTERTGWTPPAKPKPKPAPAKKAAKPEPSED